MNLSPLWLSFRIALWALFWTFLLGMAAALKMYRYQGKWRTVLDSLFLLPTVLPPVVTGFFLLLLLGKKGPVGNLLSYFGIQMIFTWHAAVMAAVIITFPLMYRSVLTSLSHLDPELLDVADIFGATELQKIRYVILPLTLPGILSGAVLTFTRALGEFGATLMVAGNIPNKTQTIPTAIYFFASSGEYDAAMFWMVVIVGLSFFFMYFVRYLERWRT